MISTDLNFQLIYDKRWHGAHGIGRFSYEIYSRLNPNYSLINGRPMTPFDPFNISLKFLNFNKENSFFYSPGPSGPISCMGIPYAITIHDLMPIEYKDEFPLHKRIYFNKIIRRVAQNANLIFTVSNFSKSRIISWLNCDQSKVIVSPNGVSSSFIHPTIKYTNLKEDYFLYIGNRRKHKNLNGLIHAFSIFSKKNKNVKLYISGVLDDSLNEILIAHHLFDRVRFLGNDLSDKFLATIYSNALAVILPSFYEGFGMPALEAISCGTPVIASDLPPLLEILGDDFVKVNPHVPESIFNGMMEIYDSPTLRDSLISSGFDNASKFNWTKTSEIILNSINRHITPK